MKKRIREVRLLEERSQGEKRFLALTPVAFRFGCKLREYELALNQFAYVFILFDPKKCTESPFELEPSVTSSDVIHVRVSDLIEQ